MIDYDFPRIVRAKIKSYRAHAFAAGLADGEDAATALRSADLLCRSHWREMVRKAEERKHINARTLRRILEQEGQI